MFSIWAPHTFPHIATMKQIFDSNAITAMAALALIIPLSARTFDLSFAYTMSLSGVTAAHFVVHDHMNVGLAMLLGIGAALIIGFINGFVVVVMRIDSFIGTLGTGSLVQAFITFVTKDNPINSVKLAGTFTTVSQHSVSGFVYVVFWAHRTGGRAVDIHGVRRHRDGGCMPLVSIWRQPGWPTSGSTACGSARC